MTRRDVTIGAGDWTAVMLNGDRFEVHTRYADTVAMETHLRANKRGAVGDNAVNAQGFVVWRALRRIGKVDQATRYESWLEDELDYLIRHDDDDQGAEQVPTLPGQPPG